MVLPFRDVGGDPQEEYFGDGIAEDITTALSKSRGLFVIARNSAFSYRGQSIDVKTVGRELGVRFVLSGTLRRAGNRVRITAQLAESATGNQLWAERYERDLTDVFAVQDEITVIVSNTVLPTLGRTERERAARKPPGSLDSWECYQRGLWHLFKFDPEEMLHARELFEKAIRYDPTHGGFYSGLALIYLLEAFFFPLKGRAETVSHAIENARNSIALDPLDATAHCFLACGLTMVGQHLEGNAEADLAVSIDPNHAWGYGVQGMARLFAGEFGEAIEALNTAMRLGPLIRFRQSGHFGWGAPTTACATMMLQ